MDIARGSRRARHVAANAAAADADVDNDRDHERQEQRRRESAGRAITTPGTTVIDSAQTPELRYDLNSALRGEAPRVVRRQQVAGTGYSRTPEEGSREVGAAPHPFRLHRSEFIFFGFIWWKVEIVFTYASAEWYCWRISLRFTTLR